MHVMGIHCVEPLKMVFIILGLNVILLPEKEKITKENVIKEKLKIIDRIFSMFSLRLPDFCGSHLFILMARVRGMSKRVNSLSKGPT